MLHGFGFGLSYTPMAVLAFSTMRTRYLTQGNAIFALIRMLGSSLFVSLIWSCSPIPWPRPYGQELIRPLGHHAASR
jgi:hypothetical protein